MLYLKKGTADGASLNDKAGFFCKACCLFVCLFTSNLKQEHVTVFMLACCNVFDIKFVCDNIL